MRVTIKDIARELHLSESAVSLALNQRPGVSDTTRQRVISCARQLGYDRSHLRTHNSKGNTVLLIRYQKRIHTPVDFFSTLLANAERELRRNGLSLISVAIEAAHDVQDQLERYVAQGCAGIIMLATEMTDGDWHPFSQLGIPIVLLDAYVSASDAPCVTINNREAARQATRLLLAEGRGCPGLLDSALFLNNFRERAEGFFSAVHEAGYPTASVTTLSLSPYVDGAETDMAERLDAGLIPSSCYFAVNDNVAIGAMRALQAHGYRIPDDVSIVGFDNTQLASFITPALTSMNVPLDYYSRLAVRLMLDLLAGAEQHPVRIEVGASLIRRASTL